MSLMKSLAELKRKVADIRAPKVPPKPEGVLTRADRDAIANRPMTSEVRVHENDGWPDNPPRGRVIPQE